MCLHDQSAGGQVDTGLGGIHHVLIGVDQDSKGSNMIIQDTKCIMNYSQHPHGVTLLVLGQPVNLHFDRELVGDQCKHPFAPSL